jgi:hypothetical protein
MALNWVRICPAIDENLVFLRGFSGNSFASLINRARARKTIKPYLVLDGGIDCEKSGGPTKQVERRGRTTSGPIDPYALRRREHEDDLVAASPPCDQCTLGYLYGDELIGSARILETARGLRGFGGDSLTCLLAAATGRRAAFAMLGMGMPGALLAAGPAS